MRERKGLTAAGKGLAPWQADRALRLLLSDMATARPVGELARLCGLSRGHFSRAFKVSMGTPPHRWLVRQRVFRALDMLDRSDEPISVIAASCGFSDQSHFTRVFRAAIGWSPAAWRRQRKAGVDGFAPLPYDPDLMAQSERIF